MDNVLMFLTQTPKKVYLENTEAPPPPPSWPTPGRFLVDFFFLFFFFFFHFFVCEKMSTSNCHPLPTLPPPSALLQLSLNTLQPPLVAQVPSNCVPEY